MERKTRAKMTTEKKEVAASNIEKNTNEMVQEVFFQYAGQEIVVKNILEKAKKEFIAEANKESDIKSIQLYIKPEENAAYYVINGKSDGKKLVCSSNKMKNKKEVFGLPFYFLR